MIVRYQHVFVLYQRLPYLGIRLWLEVVAVSIQLSRKMLGLEIQIRGEL